MTEVVGTRGSPVILTPLSISLGRRGGDMGAHGTPPQLWVRVGQDLPLADHGPDDGKPQKQSHYNIPGSQSSDECRVWKPNRSGNSCLLTAYRLSFQAR